MTCAPRKFQIPWKGTKCFGVITNSMKHRGPYFLDIFDPQGPNNCQKQSASSPAPEHPIHFMTQVPMAPIYVQSTKHLFNFKVYMAALLNPRVFFNLLFLSATPRRWRKFISCVKCKMTEGPQVKTIYKK